MVEGCFGERCGRVAALFLFCFVLEVVVAAAAAAARCPKCSACLFLLVAGVVKREQGAA